MRLLAIESDKPKGSQDPRPPMKPDRTARPARKIDWSARASPRPSFHSPSVARSTILQINTTMIGVVSSARSWLPFLLRPQKSLKSLIECWSSYDPSAWESQLELLDSGIKLSLDMMIPTLLLCLVGSFLPSPSLGESIDAGGLRSFVVQKSMVDAFSPYTSTLASSPPTSIPSAKIIQHFLRVNFQLPYLLRLITLSIISPVTIDLLFNHFAPILIQVISRLRFVLMSREGPGASTKAALVKRVQMGRAIRRHAYDLYLPSKLSNANVDCIKSLLFFPGFGIHHSAYADVAGRISDYGVPVIVVSLEPFRLAHKALGGGMDDVRRLTKSAGKEVAKYYRHLHGENNDSNSIRDGELYGDIIVEWALGGHSMGGYNALQLAKNWIEKNPPSIVLHDNSISRVGSQIVAWGAGTDVESVPNLQEAGSSMLRVFILTASNDRFAKFSSQQQKRQLLSKLPNASILETIKGGNHSGFASYDATKMSSAFNGQRDISLEAQHDEASSRTAHFLLSK